MKVTREGLFAVFPRRSCGSVKRLGHLGARAVFEHVVGWKLAPLPAAAQRCTVTPSSPTQPCVPHSCVPVSPPWAEILVACGVMCEA